MRRRSHATVSEMDAVENVACRGCAVSSRFTPALSSTTPVCVCVASCESIFMPCVVHGFAEASVVICKIACLSLSFINKP
jgi:hypothetical protein